MTRSDRVERMLRKIRATSDARLSKLRGSGAPAIHALGEENEKAREAVFLTCLACVSDADLAILEQELGLEPPRPRATRRET